MRRSKLARGGVALLLILSLTGTTACASVKQEVEDNPKGVLGGVLGAGAGAGIAALAGANPWVIAVSAIGGGLLGGYVGKQLDDRDKEMATRAAYQAFESNRTGTSVEWRNPDSGNAGTVTPTKTYQLETGQYCRQYRQEIFIGDERHETFGTACRRADGTWEIKG